MAVRGGGKVASTRKRSVTRRPGAMAIEGEARLVSEVGVEGRWVEGGGRRWYGGDEGRQQAAAQASDLGANLGGVEGMPRNVVRVHAENFPGVVCSGGTGEGTNGGRQTGEVGRRSEHKEDCAAQTTTCGELLTLQHAATC